MFINVKKINKYIYIHIYWPLKSVTHFPGAWPWRIWWRLRLGWLSTSPCPAPTWPRRLLETGRGALLPGWGDLSCCTIICVAMDLPAQTDMAIQMAKTGHYCWEKNIEYSIYWINELANQFLCLFPAHLNNFIVYKHPIIPQ